MAQILQQQDLGSILGAGVGQGLSSGLQQLAARKLEKIARHDELQRNISGLKALGIKDAEHIAHLEPKILEQVVKQKLQAPGEQAYANALSSLLGGEQQQNRPQMQEQEIGDHSYTPEVRQQIGAYLQTPEAQQQYTPEQIQKVNQFLQSPAPQPQQQAQQIQQTQKEVAPVGRLTSKQATEIAKLRLEKQKLSTQERSEAFKETKALREEIRTKKNSSKAKLEDLDRMEELEKEGKLDTAGYSEFLSRSGLDIPALMNEGSEEFNKIATNFIRDAKEYFGGRISNFEIQQFLKTVPSLSQSPEGRKRVIANLRRIEQLGVATYDAYKEVLKENNNIPPLDLGEQVDEKLDNKRDAITKRFKQDLLKPVPEGQNKYITGLQSVAGSLVGAPGKLLSAVGSRIVGKE